MVRIWRFYLGILEKNPLRTMAFTTGTLMGAGDALAQVCVERNATKYDYVRTARFVGFGAVYVGPTIGLWYRFLAKMFAASKFGNLKMVACDQLLFAPPFLASFLAGMGVLRGDNLTQIKKKLEDDFLDVIFTNWKIWPAVQTINFTFVPVQHRVLVVNFVALGWNTYLAWKTEHIKHAVIPQTQDTNVPASP